MQKKLYKSSTDKMIAGVCGGFAKYFNVDVSLIRIAWVLLVLFGGTGLLVYFIVAAILPDETEIIPADNTNFNASETNPPSNDSDNSDNQKDW